MESQEEWIRERNDAVEKGKISVYYQVIRLLFRACDSCHYLLLEFCNSDLDRVLKQRKTLPEKQAREIIDQIYDTQHDLSCDKIIHRDLKPANIGIHFKDMTS